MFEPTKQIPAEGGPAAKLAFMPGGTALLSGGVGVISLSDGVGIGLGGYSLSSDYVPSHEGVKHDLGYSYAGLFGDYSFFTRHLFYLNLSCMAGPGQAWSVARETGANRIYVDFIQFEPGAAIMLNVTHELRLGLGGSWRITCGSDIDSVLGTGLNGGTITFIMMYGKI